MNPSAILMLVVIGGIVWGGFALAMRFAIKHEKIKTSDNSK